MWASLQTYILYSSTVLPGSAEITSDVYPEYLIYTLTEFSEDDRTNDIYSRMRHIAEALTEEEINGLAGYYATAVPEEEE